MTKSEVERLDLINSEMDMLRKQKEPLSKNRTGDRKELKRIRKRMHQLSKTRSKLQITPVWTKEEKERQLNGADYTGKKRRPISKKKKSNTRRR